MNITKDVIDELNATIRISVGPEDYKEKVDQILSDYRRKANMPGFRSGKVPMGMIRKMYGKSTLAEELNKLLGEKLYQYIEQEKLDVLGQPLPQSDTELDLDGTENFEFVYDIGIAPQFDLSLTAKDKFTYYEIAVDDTIIDKYIKDLTKRHGKVSNIDAAGEEDMIYGEFTELDSDGIPVPNGITNASSIAVEYVEDDATKKALVGLKAEDTVTVNPHKVSRGPADMAKLLDVDVSTVEGITSQFQLKVTNVYRIDPAEINQQLFDQAFGQGAVNSEEEFRAKMAEQLKQSFVNDQDWKLKKDISDKLIDKLKLSLPDEFLKRWLLVANESKITEEQINADYDKYAESLKRQLIERKVMQDNELQVTREEMTEHAKGFVRQQLVQYGMASPEEEQVEALATNVLGKEEDARKIHDELLEAKILKYYKDTLKLTSKEVSMDDFVKLASEKASKSKFMDNLTNLIKFK